MKKFIQYCQLVALTGFLASCMLIAGDPSPGDVSVALSKESPVTKFSQYYGYSVSMDTYAGYLNFAEFPGTITWDDPIEHGTGTFTAMYLLYAWDGHYSHYWSDLANGWMYYQGDILNESLDYRSARASSISYTITADRGEDATFFEPPEDGEDRDYTITLTYDPADLSVSYRGMELPLVSRQVQDGSVRKVFADGHYTIDIKVDSPTAPFDSVREYRLDK